MNSVQVRQKYLDFFKQKKHAVIPPASLVPANDPTTLFTGSGMQQLVSYLKGQPHPMGKRLVDSQPSFRADDIEEVGDNRHTTFFEMLGNWSLGDYFKKEQLAWFFEFLTKEIGIEEQRLYVTVFEGSNQVPRDEESIKIWQKLFKTKHSAKFGKDGFDFKTKIYMYPAEKNWWSRAGEPKNMPAGEIGGPDSEVFFDFDPQNKLKIHDHSSFAAKKCHVNCDCGRFLEIGNSVFMEYVKKTNGTFQKLPKQNVDFGGGLERIVAASENKIDIFTTDLFKPIVGELQTYTKKRYNDPVGQNKFFRRIADHAKAAIMLVAQGVEPANKLQGYVVRRLLRRAIWMGRHFLTIDKPFINGMIDPVIEIYKDVYPQVKNRKSEIKVILEKEESDFIKLIDKGVKRFAKFAPEIITGKFAFYMWETYGFPPDLVVLLAAQQNRDTDPELEKQFIAEKLKHKELSRTASSGMFKSGLADHSEITTKLHTVTHLLHQSLRKILGNHVSQAGSNITAQRLRFDFTHPKPMSQTEIKQVESLINQKVKENLPVIKTTESKEEALKSGALAFFAEKYPARVNVYTIGSGQGWFSKELCDGPHVASTGKIGGVRIKKEKPVGSGKRRIYAVLEDMN